MEPLEVEMKPLTAAVHNWQQVRLEQMGRWPRGYPKRNKKKGVYKLPGMSEHNGRIFTLLKKGLGGGHYYP